jgi:hypothetical protein
VLNGVFNKIMTQTKKSAPLHIKGIGFSLMRRKAR